MTIPISRDTECVDTRWPILHAYVRDIANRMGVVNYLLILSSDAPEDTTDVASTCICYRSAEAKICFGDVFFTVCPEKQRITVVHELIHVLGSAHTAMMYEMTRHTPPALDTAVEIELERFVDTLAFLLAPMYPLIEWAEDHE